MNKLILVLTMTALTILLAFGIAAPDNPVMWLASTSDNFAILRLIMMGFLFGLLVTKPPRNNLFRLVLGLFSVGLAYWGISATYMNQMQFLDTMTVLTFSISCALTVLELNEKKLSRVPAMGMRRWTAGLYAAYTLRNGKL